jgi:methyl-accepting chemotaxis protein
MSEAIPSNPSKAGRRWLHLATRILVAVIIFIAAVGFMVNVAGVVGVWVVRAPARSGVTDVTATMTRALGIVDNGLARVNNLVQDARQTLTQVNDTAAKLGNRIQASSPLVTRLSQRVDNDLAPRLENVRTTASGIHDAVVTVNSTLLALNRIPGLTVPALSNQLGSLSDHAQEAQARVQDLRVTLADMKAGLVTKAEGAVTQLTTRIDTALARMQAIVNKYRAAATHAQTRISSTSNTLLLLIDLLAVSLTLLFAIFAAGLVLLMYVCWQYVRTGHFPSLHIVRTS